MTPEQLTTLCAEWQRRLGLSDWAVKVEPAQPFSLGQGERTAEIQIELGMRHARLSVLDPAHVPASIIAPHDIEECLLHELLHIHMEPVMRFEGEAQRNAVEQMLNAVASALVALKRAAS